MAQSLASVPESIRDKFSGLHRQHRLYAVNCALRDNLATQAIWQSEGVGHPYLRQLLNEFDGLCAYKQVLSSASAR